ncbi:MAG: small-conductance mechanosensitive channel [Gammaproteobacteria bacterium]|jgi:small-conductance mechanosensitive channel
MFYAVRTSPKSPKSLVARGGLLCAVMLVLNLPPAWAQDTAPALAPALASVSAEIEIEQLIAHIEDEKTRSELLAQLRLLSFASRAVGTPPASSTGAELIRELSRWLHSANSELVRSLSTLTTLPTAFRELGTRLLVTGKGTAWLKVVAKIAAVLLCAWLVQAGIKRVLSRPRTALESGAPERWLEKIPIQLGRAMLELLAIGAFAACAYAVLSLVRLSESPQLLTLAIINASILTRVVAVLGRLLFSPGLGMLRLIPTTDESAHYWFLWIRRLSTVAMYGYALVEIVLLLGFPTTLHNVLLHLLGLVVLLMLIVVVQQNRRDVAARIAGEQSGTVPVALLRRRCADVWNVFAVLYLVFVYGVWVAAKPGGFYFLWIGSVLSLLVVALAIGVRFALHRAIDRGFRLSEELRARIPPLEQRANRYVPQLKAAASILLYAVATMAIVDVWGVDALRWLENDVVRDIGARLGNIILIVLLAYIVWEALSIAIEHGLARAKAGAGEPARLQTLLPLTKKAALLAIGILVAMTVLSELGINIGPLLAGAGVLGLALGFGAQSLVKDIITGVFILIENSIAVGDYVEVGGHEGTVENVSIRTIQLRDIEGTVYTVPFSAVSTVLNFTRDFSISKLEISVAYREDVDRVVEVLNQIGAEMVADPVLGKDILEPLVVQGVQRLGDSAVIIRAYIKTTAGEQWAMRRAFHGRVKKRFDEVGIEIPFPHRTVYFGLDQQGEAPAAQARIGHP